jgi:dipeptidyl aminopeptidase/acylaminoacyl peptidase
VPKNHDNQLDMRLLRSMFSSARQWHSIIITCLAALTLTQTVSAQVSSTAHDEITNLVTSLSHIATSECPTFSPDGKSICFISDLNGSKQIWVLPAAGGFPQLVTVGDTSIPHAEWSPRDKNCIVFSTWPQGTNYYQIYSVRSDGTALRRLTTGGKTKNFGGNWSADGRQLMVASNARSDSAEELCLLDPTSAQVQWLSSTPTASALVFQDISNDRRYALVATATSYQGSIPSIFDLQTQKMTPLMPAGESQHFYGKFAPDSRTVYLITRAERERDAFGKVTIGDDGKPGPFELIAKRPDADLDYSTGWALIDPRGKTAVLDWRISDKNEVDLVDLSTGKVEHIPNLPGTRVSDMVFSPDGRQLAMNVSDQFSGSDIWTLNLATRKFHQVTFSPHAGVDFAELIRPEFVTFKSFDGTELTGWLYKPTQNQTSKAIDSAGQTATRLDAAREKAIPYVISFHGGPESQASPTREFQPLLSQGIGVFAPNVRGSSGRGKAFADLDNGALRVNAIKDIKACADYLTANGIADPKRLGIAGHSYGGYMALCGLTEYPDLFVAGMDSCGPINFLSNLQHDKDHGFTNLEYGDLTKDADMLKSLSPFYKIDRIKAPLLIQQGEKDDATPDANQIVEQLKQRGNDVEYICFPEEGHNFYKIQNRIKSETATAEFFVKHLKPTAK